MASTEITRTVPASAAMKGLVVHIRVTGVRAMCVRIWLGSLLVHLGARIIGCRAEIDGEPQVCTRKHVCAVNGEGPCNGFPRETR